MQCKRCSELGFVSCLAECKEQVHGCGSRRLILESFISGTKEFCMKVKENVSLTSNEEQEAVPCDYQNWGILDSQYSTALDLSAVAYCVFTFCYLTEFFNYFLQKKIRSCVYYFFL